MSTFYKCDRCGKELKSWDCIVIMNFKGTFVYESECPTIYKFGKFGDFGEDVHFCKSCTEDFEKFLSEKKLQEDKESRE